MGDVSAIKRDIALARRINARAALAALMVQFNPEMCTSWLSVVRQRGLLVRP